MKKFFYSKWNIISLSAFFQIIGYISLINDHDRTFDFCFILASLAIPVIIFKSTSYREVIKNITYLMLPIPMLLTFLLISIMILGSISGAKNGFSPEHLKITVLLVATVLISLAAISLPIITGSFVLKAVVNKRGK